MAAPRETGAFGCSHLRSRAVSVLGWCSSGTLVASYPNEALPCAALRAEHRFAAKPLIVVLPLVALIVTIRALGTVDSDVGWQLWIAHELNAGVVLYRDIIEANPPLWFWMGTPVDWLAGLIHVRSDHVLILTIGGLAALSVVATNRLLSDIAAPRRTLLLSYAALVLLLMPWLQTGQREQIVLLGTLPYVALISARRTGRTVGWRLAFVVGAFAAMGFALKHYFLLVPILLELWLIVGQRREWRPFRPEILATVAVGVAYAAALALWAGQYVTVVVPLILLAYGATGAEHLRDLFQPGVLTAFATIGLLVLRLRTLRSEAAFVTGLVISAVGFAGAYFLQAKGWTYQAVPLAGCAAIALAGFLCFQGKQPPVLAVAAPAFLCLPFWIAAQQAMYDRKEDADVRNAVKGLRPGDSVGFIATDPALAWPVTLQQGYQYPSRYYGFWMMRAVIQNELRGSPDQRLTALGRTVVRETVVDFRCAAPKRIIIARPAPGSAADEFDILAFFLRDPEFARLISHYQPVQRTSAQTFVLVSPLTPPHKCVRRA
jgi:hypothetical protein